MKRILKALSTVEWSWSLALLLVGGISSFVVPAWAVRASQQFSEYAPASWVGAGFVGLLCLSFEYALLAWARAKWVRTEYDKRMMAKGSYADPLAKTYENLRIYLNEFCLPSHALIENKTFINCEIIGPANIMLQIGNNVAEARYPICDAVLLKDDLHNIYNTIVVRNCIFRQCSFQRITYLVPKEEYQYAKDWAGFNWITHDVPKSIQEMAGGDTSPAQANNVVLVK
jgi:hypothetical protein